MTDNPPMAADPGVGKPWRPHPTERVVNVLARLRIYRPVMRALHKAGQCWQRTRILPNGRRARICDWCGARNGHPDDLAQDYEEIARRMTQAARALDGDTPKETT